MAKKDKKRSAGSKRAGKAGGLQAKPGSSRRAQGRQSRGPSKTAADALLGLLESPLVADILAAGAAAALAAIVQRGSGASASSSAAKKAARAAAAAMGGKLAEEVEQILKSSRKGKAKREEA